jgi:hypothetical protein
MENKPIMELSILDFFKRATGLEPIEIEKQILVSFLDPTLLKVAVCSARQTGKSLTIAVGVVWLALHSEKRINIVVVSVKENHVYDWMRIIFNSHPELKDLLSFEGTFSIIPLKGFEILKTRTKVILASATEKGLRGTPADILVLDEAGQIRDSIIQTAICNLSNDSAKILMVSTPHVYKSKFNQIVRNPIKFGYKLFNWSMADCFWKRKQMEGLKLELSEDRYPAEVLGLPLTEEEQTTFQEEEIDNLVKDEVLAEGKGYITIGIDWGIKRSKTVMTIIERISSTRKLILKTYEWDFLSNSKPFEEMASIINSLKKVKYINADSQPDDFRGQLEPFLGKGIINYVQANQCKDNLIGQLKTNVRFKQIEIAYNETELIDQLKHFKRNKVYDTDYVDSLALGLFEAEWLKQYKEETPIVDLTYLKTDPELANIKTDKFGFLLEEDTPNNDNDKYRSKPPYEHTRQDD